MLHRVRRRLSADHDSSDPGRSGDRLLHRLITRGIVDSGLIRQSDRKPAIKNIKPSPKISHIDDMLVDS